MPFSAPAQTYSKESNKPLVWTTPYLCLCCISPWRIIIDISITSDSPARIALFNNIAVHVSEQLQGNGEPAHKKRKVEAASNGVDSSVPSGIDPAEEQVLLEVKEISVSVPQRKKFELCFTAEHLYARAPGTTVPAPNIVYAWRDIGRSPGSLSSVASSFLTLCRVCILPPSTREGPGPAQLHSVPTQLLFPVETGPTDA